MSARESQRSLRHRIARDAARIMAEGGITDYQLAKRKAVSRLRCAKTVPLPANHEIEQALQEYQRLFRGESQPHRLLELRKEALEAMRFLETFSPRLVGPVLSGTADEHSRICLHLFSDPPEDVAIYLDDRGIAYRESECNVRLTAEETQRLPAYSFVADDIPIDLVVFSGSRRYPPLSPVDGRPMQRAGVRAVQALLSESTE